HRNVITQIPPSQGPVIADPADITVEPIRVSDHASREIGGRRGMAGSVRPCDRCTVEWIRQCRELAYLAVEMQFGYPPADIGRAGIERNVQLDCKTRAIR